MDGLQLVFLVCCFLLLPVVAVLYKHAASVIAALQASAEASGGAAATGPRLEDLMIGLYATIAICVLRLIVVACLKPVAKRLLSEKKRLQEGRVERWATCVFKLSYFICITTCGWHLFSNEPWFPESLGGSGSTRECYTNYGFQEFASALRTYYLIQLGYHCHSLVFLVLLPWRSDLGEMLTHHSVTIVAVVFSYVTHYLRIGALVLFVHDVGDITGYAIKASVDTPYTKFTLALYVLLLASWFYSRLWVFPTTIIPSILFESGELVPEHTTFQRGIGVLMLCLQALHIYWYCLFIKMGLAFLSTGKTEDVQDKEVAPVHLENELTSSSGSRSGRGHSKKVKAN